MRIAILCATILILPLILQAAEPAADQASQLEQLSVEIGKILPNGWTVAVWPATKSKSIFSLNNNPSFIVYRNEACFAEFTNAANLPVQAQASISNGRPTARNPDLKPMEITFRFSAMPFMSKEEYKKAKQENDSKLNTRMESAKTLRGINWSHMGPEPIPPSAYEPQNENERNRVRQYAYVWLNTQPQALPDLYFQRLSFKADLMEDVRCSDKQIEEEVKRVREKVVQLFSKYEP
jgi:hypothetical protein